MHKRVVFAVSTVLFALLALTAVIVTDLHDRGFPVELGATTLVVLDFAESGLADDEAFAQLGLLSDRLGLGLVKIAPDLSGDQSGQVFVAVGDHGRFPETIRRFGDQPDSQIRDHTALAHSYASGRYLITGETTRQTELQFQEWLTAHGITARWEADALGDILQLLVRQSSFGVGVLAAITLMVSLVLYWLSVKAKGRALRVLSGVSLWRIQYEDLGGFLAVMVAGAALCGAVATIAVGIVNGWGFAPYYVQALLAFIGIVILATMAAAVVMSVASWPSVNMIAAREPAVTSLRKTSVVLKVSTFALVLFTVAPAFAALADSRAVAAEQARWRSLADQVALWFPAGTGESGFQQLMGNVGEVVRDAEARDLVALSYTWTNDLTDGALGPYDHLSLVNLRWLDLMLEPDQGSVNRERDSTLGLIPPGSLPSSLVRITTDQIPERVSQYFGPQFALSSREQLTDAEALDQFSFYRYTGAARFPMSLGGNGDLVFSHNPLIVVAPSLYDSFNDSFFASVASSSNLVFTGLGPTQELLTRHGLQNRVYVKYVAEDGLLRAQFTAYVAWLRGLSLVALAVALVVSTLIGAFITAVLNARRDFPLRLAGKRWAEILADRVVREWAVGFALTAMVILIRGFDGVILVAVIAMAGLLLSPLTHGLAARWTFERVIRRGL